MSMLWPSILQNKQPAKNILGMLLKRCRLGSPYWSHGKRQSGTESCSQLVVHVMAHHRDQSGVICVEFCIIKLIWLKWCAIEKQCSQSKSAQVSIPSRGQMRPSKKACTQTLGLEDFDLVSDNWLFSQEICSIKDLAVKCVIHARQNN